MTRKRVLILCAIVLGVAAFAPGSVALWGAASPGKPDTPGYLTQPVTRGEVSRSITASGTLNPVNQVQVGTQVSGLIRAIHVDYNSNVKAGQLLAEVDPVTLDADLASGRALLESAEASEQLANAQLKRNRGLFEQGFISRSDLEQSQEKLATAGAQVRQQRAAVLRYASNRRNAEIRSPVSGVVVSRDVSVGQTVQASFATPTLFKIAQDLRQMQIDASISEADIGSVKEGQPVRFTVDTFADKVFSGTVTQIRNNYAVQQNVVTYTVVVRTENPDMTLRPGMTAYVKIDVAARMNVLRIQNAALRYNGPTNGEPVSTGTLSPEQRRVWKLQPDGSAQAVVVKVGITDGRTTELVIGSGAGALKEGDALVIGVLPKQSGFPGPKLF